MKMNHPNVLKSAILWLLCLCILTMDAPRGHAQNLRAIKRLNTQNLSPAERKINGHIREAITTLTSGENATLFMRKRNIELSDNSLVKIDEATRIQCYIYLSEVNDDQVAILRSHEVEIEITNDSWNIVQAWVPSARLYDIAKLDFVRFVTSPDYAVKMTGSVTTEGDEVLGAKDVRENLGFDGTGIKVGVISDGVDTRAESQSTDDLPPSIEINPRFPGENDEGTAMLEIVHDLAPGAQLAFSGPATNLEMIPSIRFLADTAFAGTGCDIIVDDLGFFGEPTFEDGPIAQVVEEVVANGIVYFTAVGNQAQNHHEAEYVEVDFAGDKVHDFGTSAGGGSDGTMDVTINPEGELTIVLQWNDPFSGSNNDYDLFLIDADADTTLDQSTQTQNGTQPPIEAVTYENKTATTIQAEVVVANLTNAATRLLEMFLLGEKFDLQEFNIPEGSVVPGQQSSSVAISVGAIFVLDQNNDIEFFSARGPARIFFPSEELRTKPDIVATDGGLITGAGGFGQELPPNSGDIRFFGTSAAAPHAAAVGALVLDAEPSLTPTQLRNVLANSALDLGPAGTDNTFGAGKIDALAAVNLVTSVADEQQNTPNTYRLAQNYPNPFNPTTLITYTLPPDHGNENVTLEIFNTLGQKIRTLVNATQTTGNYQIEWNGKSDRGKQVASGPYVYRLQAGQFVQMKKMLLLR
ncbi:S8 family serine peptidase [candidate division KSB1 bacterium]|nr:S8 family serine peptidase [candidate division KSB1 bacterium]